MDQKAFAEAVVVKLGFEVGRSLVERNVMMALQGEGIASTRTGHGGWKRKVTFIEPLLEARAMCQNFCTPYFVFSECLYWAGSDRPHFTEEKAPTAENQCGWLHIEGYLTLKTRHLIKSTLCYYHPNLP